MGAEAEEEVNHADDEKPSKFTPTESLKKLFKKIASKIHPDKAKNEEDTKRRNTYMAQLNSAYEICDEDTMNEILARYELEGEVEDIDVLAIQLQRARESLEAITKKMAYMSDEIQSLQESRWMRLKIKIETDESSGIDALGVLAEEIYEKILDKQNELNELRNEIPEEVEETTTEEPDINEDNAEQDNQQTSGRDDSFRSEFLIHRTLRGEKVRSKSEMIIANMIFDMGLDYRYEYPLEGHITLGIKRPDFVFFTKDRSIIVWEHLGMLDNKIYARKWKKKLEWYTENGFVEGETLFVTKDKPSEGFDSQGVHEVAKAIEKLVQS